MHTTEIKVIKHRKRNNILLFWNHSVYLLMQDYIDLILTCADVETKLPMIIRIPTIQSEHQVHFNCNIVMSQVPPLHMHVGKCPTERWPPRGQHV